MDGVFFCQRAVDDAEAFVRCLTLTKSTKSGLPEPFEPMPWFRKLLWNLYGWRREDGRRLIKRCFASVARKNAKTQNIAALALAEFFNAVDDEAEPEIYMAAKSIEQASYCFSAAAGMVRADPYLDEICKITDSTKTIRNKQTGGVLKCLSAEGKSKHGSNPSCVIFDELHAWDKTEQELYDALTSGSVARRQPLFLMITTAGHELESICGREYLYARDILKGEVTDPHYLPLIYEVPRDADWTDESLWHLANPGLGITVTMEALLEECQTAKQKPSEQNKFRRLHLNQWTETSDVWIPPHEWDQCKAEEEPALDGLPCYCGLDLSLSRDLSAFSCVWPTATGLYARTFFFIPEADLRARSLRDHVSYDLWRDQGHIVITPGATIRHEFISDWILDFAQRHAIAAVAYDRYGAPPVVQRLEDAGLRVIRWGQGFVSMNAPAQQLESLVYSRRIQHDGNPVLRWNFGCCSKAEDSSASENIKPVKAKGAGSNQRIDGVVALVMAIGAHMAGADAATPEVWIPA